MAIWSQAPSPWGWEKFGQLKYRENIGSVTEHDEQTEFPMFFTESETGKKLAYLHINKGFGLIFPPVLDGSTTI